jgi:hypothetical protein
MRTARLSSHPSHHALAATRGEGLRPEFLDLFKRQAGLYQSPRSNDDAKHESKVHPLSAEELAKRAKELADGFSTDPLARGDDSRL